MTTRTLEQFAQSARRSLHEQVAARLAQVLAPESAARREKPGAVKALTQQIRESSRQEVIEAVAYTWFNRFCALRYMDANHYTRVGVVSPAAGGTQPEILQDAKQGHIDPELPLAAADRERIFDLLAGRLPARDPQTEAYRLLLVAACNSYHSAMPFLFEEIDDYSELLMPDDLLSERSLLSALRAALTPDACANVEVIGWLYQFYISEKKDEVIGSKAKIQAGDIPAATQLFTPHWIVRYLVENSLGRLWMQNRPGSRLAERMDYYIPAGTADDGRRTTDDGGPQTADSGRRTTDEQANLPISQSPNLSPRHESGLLPITSPTEIRLCDPAAGSGHMLTYAFDLLYAIYEEEGYPPREIPGLILTHNLYGMEIDPRAGALAAFALTMKAREKERRFLGRGVTPRITLLRPLHFSDAELAGLGWLQELGKNLVDLPLYEALLADLRAVALLDNAGSLLRPRLSLEQIAEARRRMEQADDLFTHELNQRVGAALASLEALARPYHIVVANPPYMGSGNANDELKEFAKAHYPESKADLFAMFIERNLELVRSHGLVAMITMQSWMFLSSYEKLREKLLDERTILSMAHLGARAFDTIGGEVVSTTAFVLEKAARPDYKGVYLRLIDGNSEAEKAEIFREIINADQIDRQQHFYRVSVADFRRIPGSPISYWIDDWIKGLFSRSKTSVADISISDGQTKTGDNDRFLRMLWEVPRQTIGKHEKWRLHPKGGSFRKWFGNVEWVIDWSPEARQHYRKDRVARIMPEYLWDREGISWTNITGDRFSFRILESGHIFNLKAPSLFFGDEIKLNAVMGYLNSPIALRILGLINSTISLNVGEVRSLPISVEMSRSAVYAEYALDCTRIAKSDWDSYETSWDFSDLPLLRAEFRGESLAAAYAALRRHWQAMTDEMQRLEEENNRLFIAAYGLQDELSPEVPLAEITLTCNPHYRYGSGELSVNSDQLRQLTDHWSLVTAHWSPGDEGRELRLLADTMREFISYAVGCLFGRYSLDRPGLVLADAGQGIEDYLRLVSGGRQTTDDGRTDDAPTPDTNHAARSTQHTSDPRNSQFATRPAFPPDRDNVIPILDGDWFEDDMADRFRRFLRVTFGEARYEENLRFIEAALGRDIRSYFLREFYDDHLKRYQKRPIYWLFSSPKGSFNALIYLHRYRPDTPSVVLNEYLREFQSKLSAHRRHLEGVSISAGSTAGEKSAALREIAKLDKILAELREYESDTLYPLAIRQVALDLDDGVKVNYAKLGDALKGVKGL